MSILVYFLGSFVLLSHCVHCESAWEKMYKLLSERLDDIVFDMKSKDNSMTKQVRNLISTVTATNKQLAFLEKRLSEVADCSAKLVVVEERLAYIDTHVKEVTAAEVGRRTHHFRRGLEKEKAATMTRFESLRKNQEQLLSRSEDIERFQGAIVTRADDMDTRLNQTLVQIYNLDHYRIVSVYNTSTLFTKVANLENTQATMKVTEDKTRALIAVITDEVKSTHSTFNTLQSQVQTLVGTQADLQSKTRAIEAKVDNTRADISRLHRKVDGQWGSWTSWSLCTSHCKQTRARVCDNPAPLHGGRDCPGLTTQTQGCHTDLCQIDGQWGSWTSWSSCTSHCSQTRNRACDNPAPLHGGRDCPGPMTHTQDCNTSSCLVTDCSKLLSKGAARLSGVYNITTPLTHTKIQVYCDMETDGGGWTVFQRRFDGSVDFYRNFTDYENGFGSVQEEHWLGLKYLHEIASQGGNQFRLDIVRANGSKGFDVYDKFSVGPGTDYTFHVGSRLRFSGCQSLLSDTSGTPDGNSFSTYDHDNDKHRDSCAQKWTHGGWWYNECATFNPNGLYQPGLSRTENMRYSGENGLKATTLMFKPI